MGRNILKDDLDHVARQILRTNDKGGYTVPTSGLYPYQWNWDSAFVALGFAQFDESRACTELETLFDAQWSDGFVPHIVFRQDDPNYFPGPTVWQAGSSIPTSGITQPPVAASVLNSLWSLTSSDTVKDRLAALFPKVLAWHRWFHRFRIPKDIGAVVITHPWESGRDNSPEWDGPLASIDTSNLQPYQRCDLNHADADMRPTQHDYDRYVALVEFGRGAEWNHRLIATEGPFRVADVGMTMILLRASRDLAAMARILGLDNELAELVANTDQLEAGIEYLWDQSAGTFCSRDTVTGLHSGLISNASFLYCYAGVATDAQHKSMAAHWARISASTKFMMPSLDPHDARFDHGRYWRGPIWTVVNYMLAQGFTEYGLAPWATRIREDSAALIREHGFHEAFSPLTGSGTGGKGFSWTAAMWLAWCGNR